MIDYEVIRIDEGSVVRFNCHSEYFTHCFIFSKKSFKLKEKLELHEVNNRQIEKIHIKYKELGINTKHEEYKL